MDEMVMGFDYPDGQNVRDFGFGWGDGFRSKP